MNSIFSIIFIVICTRAITEATSLSSSAALSSLTFCVMHVGVSGWFGLFRRRKSSPASAMIPSNVQEMSAGQSETLFPFLQNPSGFFPNAFSPVNPFGMSNPMFGNVFQQQQAQRQNFQNGMAKQMSQQQIPQNLQNQVFQQMQQNSQMQNLDQFSNDDHGDQVAPGMNAEEAESFFSLLAETDESQCISRLVCEMGADPAKAGEFGESISEIIGSLENFPPGSKTAHYNHILQNGKQKGLQSCTSSFSDCDDESLQMVRTAQTEG